MKSTLNTHNKIRPTDVFLLAAWFGLICGVIEGIGLLAFQELGWQHSKLYIQVTSQIVWLSAIYDFVLFIGIAAMLVLLRRFLGRFDELQAVTTVFICLTAFDWLSLVAEGRLRHYALFTVSLGLALALGRGCADTK